MGRIFPKRIIALLLLIAVLCPKAGAESASELTLATREAGTWLHMLDDEKYRECMESLRYPPKSQRGWLQDRQSERAEWGDILERELESTSRSPDSFQFKYRAKFQKGLAYQLVKVQRFGVVRWAVSSYKIEKKN
ncbi:MAG: hypothetical protein KDD66_13260 [Bdellovibrionales bacterium]|nr:hypothetical protein [Bdellovibrionales bacterium]